MLKQPVVAWHSFASRDKKVPISLMQKRYITSFLWRTKYSMKQYRHNRLAKRWEASRSYSSGMRQASQGDTYDYATQRSH